jgi:hypothetical protein
MGFDKSVEFSTLKKMFKEFVILFGLGSAILRIKSD